MEFAVLDVAVFVIFLVAVITVGVLKSRGERDSEAYFLAGRGLNWWLIGFSLIAANISAEQFVGMSGQAAKDSIGLAVASYEWIAAVTLVVVAFFFLPKFLRSGIYTIPEYLEYRFNHAARTIMSLLMVIIYVGVTIATVIFLGAKALEPLFRGQTLFGMPVDIVSLAWAVGIVAAGYVAAGGLKACAWADLIQGSALIVGGAVIMVFAFMALDRPGDFEGINAEEVHKSLGVDEDASLTEKFMVLKEGTKEGDKVVKEGKMHMVLPWDNDFLPWTALLLGIWIPNFYYWGLNQYIMQRTLGASSLSQGQKGVVFAAALKLIIPFIVCIPGIIAFTLYGEKMQENAMNDKWANAPALKDFQAVKGDPAGAKTAFPFDKEFAKLHAKLAEEIFRFNLAVAGVEVAEGAPLDEIRAKAIAAFAERDPAFKRKVEEIDQFNKNRKPDEKEKKLTLAELNGEAVALATGEYRPVWQRLFSGKSFDVEKKQELVGYDYDGAFPLLIRYLTPNGWRGFVLAALMGAVISSLASMLNAASTIFTMDLYREYVNRNASQTNLVWVGRACVPVCVVIGCLIAPQLADPKFKGAFAYIQEFQGYVSPGVLTIFLFGLFIPRSPRMCGVIGLVLSPVIYGLLHLFWGDLAFLNRMAITVGALAAVLAVITVVSPLKEPVTLPVQAKFDMTSSHAAKIFGLIVVAATVVLYVLFW
jgi:SSS family solute:Na+ symporter